MTRIIRSDLEGVVHAHLHDGTLNAVVLKAGDVVPDGVAVGDHLLAPEQEDDNEGGPADDTVPNKPVDGDDEPADDEDEASDDDEPADDEDEASDDDEPADDGDEDDGDEDELAEGLDAPRGNASTEAWAEYADALGVEIEPSATRTEIQAAIAASKA